jgi:hypothetical protein
MLKQWRLQMLTHVKTSRFTKRLPILLFGLTLAFSLVTGSSHSSGTVGSSKPAASPNKALTVAEGGIITLPPGLSLVVTA